MNIGYVESLVASIHSTVSYIGKFIQLDTIVYPRSAKPRSLVKIPLKVKGWMSKSTPKQRIFPKFKVPHCSLMLTMCQDIHLQPIHEVLMEGHVAEEHGIAKIAHQIIDVLEHFLSRCIYVSKTRRVVPWEDDAIKKVC